MARELLEELLKINGHWLDDIKSFRMVNTSADNSTAPELIPPQLVPET